jgi:hypothetical protein
MKPSRKDLAVLAISFVVVSALSWLANWAVARFVTDGGMFSVTGGWIYWPFAFPWVVDAILFGVTGLALAILLDVSHQELWALALGALHSLILLALSPFPLKGDVPGPVYFWVYGAYFVPPVASWLTAMHWRYYGEQQMRYPA